MSHVHSDSFSTILCRKDPKDLAEWQFALGKEVAFKETKTHHAATFEANQKMEALDWIKARQHGSMGVEDGFQAEDALVYLAAETRKT